MGIVEFFKKATIPSGILGGVLTGGAIAAAFTSAPIVATTVLATTGALSIVTSITGGLAHVFSRDKTPDNVDIESGPARPAVRRPDVDLNPLDKEWCKINGLPDSKVVKCLSEDGLVYWVDKRSICLLSEITKLAIDRGFINGQDNNNVTLSFSEDQNEVISTSTVTPMINDHTHDVTILSCFVAATKFDGDRHKTFRLLRRTDDFLNKVDVKTNANRETKICITAAEELPGLIEDLAKDKEDRKKQREDREDQNPLPSNKHKVKSRNNGEGTSRAVQQSENPGTSPGHANNKGVSGSRNNQTEGSRV